MAKKKIDIDKYASGLFLRTEQYADKVRQHYATAVDELLKLSANRNISPDELFSFSDNKKLSEKANNVLRGLYSAVYNEIKGGVMAEWEYANLSCDALIESIFGKGLNENNHFARWFSRNQEAMDAFFARKSAYGGMNLSQKVWKYTGDLKTEMELALSLSLGQGDSASTVSRKVRQYLQEPDKLFRRIKTGTDANSNPLYKLSKAAKAYHPGRGVYRSSYKNAMRLTRTETNMAYRASEQDRWQRMDFVVGYEVKRSKRGFDCKVCEALKGKYPKDFVFRGWHAQCRCVVVPILATDDEFIKMQEKILAGESPTSIRSVNTIRRPNQNFYDWWEENKGRVETATTMPYWVQDNQDYINKKRKIRVRTDEEREAIRKKWAERSKKYQTITKMANNVLKVAQEYPEIDLTALQSFIDKRNIGQMNIEARSVAKQIVEIRKDEQMLSALIPDVHEWKKQFTSAELHEVYDAVEKGLAKIDAEQLNMLKYNNILEQKKALLEKEIKYVADPNYLKPHKLYPTWKVSQDAYTIQLNKVIYQIDVESINAQLQPIKEYVAKNKGAKKLSNLLDNVESSISANSDLSVIHSNYVELEKSWLSLQKANATRQAKKISANRHIVFDEKCFSESRKKKAITFDNARDADDYYFQDAVDAYSRATPTFKQAAESYTRNSSSITRILRGMDGWLEYDVSYININKPYIEAMTDAISQTRLRKDCWIVRDERASFFALKAGNIDVNSLERNIESYTAKITAKYRSKYGKITSKLQRELDDKIARYKKHEERQLVGRVGTDPSFCSTSSHMNAKFTGTGGDNKYGIPKVHLEIYCPQGTQALYAAPYNYYNGKRTGVDGFWDGKSKPTSIYEAEIFLQRGSKFRVLEAEYIPADDRWMVKVEVIEQAPFDILDYERVYDRTNGRYGYKPKFK